MKVTFRSKPLFALAASAIITGALVAPAWPYGSPSFTSATSPLGTGCISYTCPNFLIRLVAPNTGVDWTGNWTCIYLHDGTGRYSGTNIVCSPPSMNGGCCTDLAPNCPFTGPGPCDPPAPGSP